MPPQEVAWLLRAPMEAGATRDGHLFACIFYLALRVGESILMKPTYFDFEHGSVRVPSLKKRRWKVKKEKQDDGTEIWTNPSAEERAATRANGPGLVEIHMLPEAREPLAAIFAWSRGRDWCFPGGKAGQHMTSRTAEYIFTKWRDALGLDRAYTPHTLRHSACSMMAETTKDPVLVRDFARHSNVTTTNIYLHRGPTRWKGAAGSLTLPGG